MGRMGRGGQKLVMVSSDHFTLLVFFVFLYIGGVLTPVIWGL